MQQLHSLGGIDLQQWPGFDFDDAALPRSTLSDELMRRLDYENSVILGCGIDDGATYYDEPVF